MRALNDSDIEVRARRAEELTTPETVKETA